MQDPNELIRRASRALVAPCLNAIAVICIAGITLVALRGPITDSVKKALISCGHVAPTSAYSG